MAAHIWAARVHADVRRLASHAAPAPLACHALTVTLPPMACSPTPAHSFLTQLLCFCLTPHLTLRRTTARRASAPRWAGCPRCCAAWTRSCGSTWRRGCASTRSSMPSGGPSLQTRNKWTVGMMGGQRCQGNAALPSCRKDAHACCWPMQAPAGPSSCLHRPSTPPRLPACCRTCVARLNHSRQITLRSCTRPPNPPTPCQVDHPGPHPGVSLPRRAAPVGQPAGRPGGPHRLPAAPVLRHAAARAARAAGGEAGRGRAAHPCRLPASFSPAWAQPRRHRCSTQGRREP